MKVNPYVNNLYVHVDYGGNIWEPILKRDLLAIFRAMKYDVKCGMCPHKYDCRETTLSNAANQFKIFLIELEICLYKHLYFLYIRNPLFPIAVFISMLLQVKVNMFLSQKQFSNCIKHQKVQ